MNYLCYVEFGLFKFFYQCVVAWKVQTIYIFTYCHIACLLIVINLSFLLLLLFVVLSTHTSESKKLLVHWKSFSICRNSFLFLVVAATTVLVVRLKYKKIPVILFTLCGTIWVYSVYYTHMKNWDKHNKVSRITWIITVLKMHVFVRVGV